MGELAGVRNIPDCLVCRERRWGKSANVEESWSNVASGIALEIVHSNIVAVPPVTADSG
jgi:hypothetical protein